MTALNLYGINTASVTLATADQLVTANGGANVAGTGSKCGTATGYGEVLSQGSAAAWPAGGSAPAPSGNGWLFDSTLLEGQTIAAGTWTILHHVLYANGTQNVVADVYMRVYKRSSGGIYTLIGTLLLSALTITTASTLQTWSGALSSMAFATGDKLYHDVIPNITTPGNAAGTQLKTARGSGATGASNFAEIDTPGYSPTPSGSHILIADGYGGAFS